MKTRGGRIAGAVAALLMAALPMAAAAASPLANWAAIVVAGDYHAAHADKTTEAFDNARRDVTRALVTAGFNAGNIQQFSVRPQNYPDEKTLLPTDIGLIDNSLIKLAGQAREHVA